ncbi:hypothetical protein HNR00_000515 [Methylorubrum rhodinum]|uniref:Uncharacterized protein n=1 Tax=Methylorubrum rhodinum TaxID=29428 RepID=A0A840ZDV6_9HYPH|nr:hypothetical protein [Methylorubrum rhodinum]MBB5755819.1 hypothetical protein [Methylorubrum rhodinum]
MSFLPVIALVVLGAPAVVPWAAYGLSGRFPGLKFNLVSAVAIYIYAVCVSYGPFIPELLRRGCFSTHHEALTGPISMNVCHDWPIILIDSAAFWPLLAACWLASLCVLKIVLTARSSMTKGVC